MRVARARHGDKEESTVTKTNSMENIRSLQTTGQSLATATPLAEHDAPTREEIEHRAYEIYIARGGEYGHDLEDWIQAERELLERRGKTTSA